MLKGGTTMNKGKIKKMLTSKIGIAVITGLICFSIGASGNSSDIESETKISTLQQELDENKNRISQLETENETLQAKVDEAQPWFELKEEERQAQIAQAEKEKAEAEAKAKAEAEEAERIRKEQEEAEAKKGYDTGITYDNLARTPDDYKGQKIKFYGKVIQVMEGDTETQIRLAVNDDYNTVILCGIPKGTTSVRILEDDMITVMGTSIGLYTYQSTMGGKITIPAMYVDKVEM